MTVHCLLDALQDTATLVALSKETGLTHMQVRAVFAAIHDLPVVQVLRIGATAKADKIRQFNRETRKENSNGK